MRFYCLVALVAMVMCGNAFAASNRIREAERFPAEKTLTLEDCITIALKNQPAVRQAAAEVEFQAGSVSRSRSRLLPSASVNSSTFISGSGRNSGTGLSAGVDQLIFDFGRSTSGLTESEKQRMASVAAYISARADTILNVKQSYYTLLRTTDLVSVFEENLRSTEGHVSQAQERLNAGLAPRSDLLKAQAASASARVDLVTARNNRDQAHVDLNVAMGIDVRSAMKIAESSEPSTPVPDADQAVDTALINRPESRQSQAKVAAAEAALKGAKTGNLPALSTSVGDFKNFGGTSVNDANSWEWTVNMRWQPFDSGLTRGAVMQARALLVAAEESYYTVKQSIGSDVVSARFSLLAAQESLVAAQAEVASAREDLDAATGRYNAGIAIFLEVTDAQAVLLKAQVDELVARYGISIARAGLERAIGATSVGGTGK